MEYMITRQSISNRCNSDGELHLEFTEAEKPCKEAYLKELLDKSGELCSRYFIDIEPTVEAVNNLGKKYDVDILITENTAFPDVVALVLYDEERE